MLESLSEQGDQRTGTSASASHAVSLLKHKGRMRNTARGRAATRLAVSTPRTPISVAIAKNSLRHHGRNSLIAQCNAHDLHVANGLSLHVLGRHAANSLRRYCMRLSKAAVFAAASARITSLLFAKTQNAAVRLG